MQLLIDLVFLLLAAAGGAGATCLVLWLRAAPLHVGPISLDDSFARETLARLHELTRSVAAEVDQHTECVLSLIHI